MSPNDILAGSLVFFGIVASLYTINKITVKIAVLIINRRQSEPQSSVSLDVFSRQLAALQQAVDATAIEVERLGEFQRFTSKQLAERADAGATAIGPGARPPS